MIIHVIEEYEAYGSDNWFFVVDTRSCESCNLLSPSGEDQNVVKYSGRETRFLMDDKRVSFNTMDVL